MFKAIIEFKDNTQITIDNKREFMKLCFDKISGISDERSLGIISSIIYSGILIDYDISYINDIIRDSDISNITFECYQVKKQHHNVKVYMLDKEALNNFMSMMGIKDTGVHTGATYYHNNFIWEVSKTTVTL
jgi:hypothetical protein